MAKNNFHYIQLSPNFRLVVNEVEQNGLKYNLHFTAGGAYFEQHGQKGISHLLEHCMLTRTKNLNIEELKNFIFEKDLYANAYTDRLAMEFIISGHKDDSKDMLDMIMEVGYDPYIDENVINQEKEVVLREINQFSGGVKYRLNRLLIESVFEPESLAFTEVLGTTEDVGNATLEDFKIIHRRMLENSHFVLTVAGGGIDIDSIKKKIEPYLANLPSDKTLPVNYQPRNKVKDFKYMPIVSDLGHEHAVLNIVIPCPVTLENRPARAYLRELLFESPIGILYDRLRNQLGLIYSLNYSFDISSDSLSIEISSEIANLNTIVKEIKAVFSDFEKIISEKRAEKIRDLVIKRRELNEDDPQFVVDFSVNILLDYGVIINYEDYVKEMSMVSLDDIRLLYEQIHTNLEQMRIVVVSNKKEIKKLKF